VSPFRFVLFATALLAACGGSRDAGPKPVDAVRSTLSAVPGSITADGAAQATLTATALDVDGVALAGLPAVFSVSGSGNALSATTARTGVDGVATVTLTSTKAERKDVIVVIDGVPLKAHAVTDFVAGPAASLLLTDVAGSATAGRIQGFKVMALDARGNVATGYAGTVRVSSTDAAATVPADLTFSAPDAGVRVASGLTLRTAGVQSVAATDSADATMTSALNVVVSPAAASALVFERQPPDAVAGATVAPSVRVAVLDAFGNLVTGSVDTVTLSLVSGPTATLLGTTSGVPFAGVADFGDLALHVAGRGFKLAASSAALTGAESAAFSIVAATAEPAVSDVVATPMALAVNDPVALTATVRDAYGNPVVEEAVIFGVTGAGNSIANPPGTTDAAGKAYGSLLSTKAETKVVTGYLSAGRAMGGTARVIYNTGPPAASQSTLVATPASTTDDGAPVSLIVTVKDQFGTPFAGAEVTFASSGPATTTNPAQPTDAAGVATGSVSAYSAGTLTLTAYVGSTAIAAADVTFRSAPPNAATSRIELNRTSAPADGTTVVTITVSVLDSLGRGVAGQDVSLSYSGTASFPASAAVTDPLGRASFTATAAAPTSGTLQAVVDPAGAALVLAAQPALTFVTPTHSVGGQVSGLSTPGLVLTSPGLADLEVPAGATAFMFSDGLPSGASYSVGVKAQPAGLVCAVLDGSGIVGGGDVTSVAIDCASEWVQVAVGTSHTLGLRSDGTLYAWGDNSAGQLGDGSTTNRRIPVPIGIGFAAVSAGRVHSLGLKTNGDLYAWGENTYGQLGDISTTRRSAPVLVGSGYAAISAGGYHSLGLKINGDLYAWGFNNNGQLGDNSTANRDAPVLIGAGWAAISAGGVHSFGLKANGDLYAWGANPHGQLGDSTTTPSTTPILVGDGFTAVAAGGSHSLGLKAGGDLYAWGDNSSGQVVGPFSLEPTPPHLVGTGYSAISAGNAHSFGLTAKGDLLAWGNNSYGQLGDGSTLSRAAPFLVGAGFSAVSAGGGHSIGLKTGGSLYAWGTDFSGQLGDDAASQRNVPGRVRTGFISISAGGSHSLGLTANGDLYAWGDNWYGQLGDSSTHSRAAPFLVGTAFSAVSAGSRHSLGLKTNGDLYAWGDNIYGKLGDGSTAQRNAPVFIGGGFIAVSAGGDHSLGVKANGDLYAWGANSFGQLGDTSTTARSFPVLIGFGFTAVSAGGYHSLGTKANGDLYAWGGNTWGQLGNSSTVAQGSPVFVGAGFTAISAGVGHSLGVKANGDLYAWGDNLDGQLGDNSTAQRNAPVFISGGFIAASAGSDHSLGLRADGDLFAWGFNRYGQLGDNSIIARQTPALVGAGFTAVSAGSAHSLALQANGDLYAWGYDADGQVGDGHALLQATSIEILWPPKPDYLAYAPTTAVFAVGIAITPPVPTWSGVASTFQVTPAFPAGLTLDSLTGVVSGMPTAPSPTTSYAITATGPTGATTALLTITVN
jgi:alpha-tubulin suppressor-like RCC1 family protein